jgi:hypothetical protein
MPWLRMHAVVLQEPAARVKPGRLCFDVACHANRRKQVRLYVHAQGWDLSASAAAPPSLSPTAPAPGLVARLQALPHQRAAPEARLYELRCRRRYGYRPRAHGLVPSRKRASICECRSGPGTSRSSGAAPRYDSKPNVSSSPVSDCRPSLEEGMPGRRPTLHPPPPGGQLSG